MRKGISITVTPADRVRLQSIMRDRNSPQKHVWRARIIVLTADGNGTTAITRAVGKAQEKALVFRTEKRRSPHSGRPYPWIVKSTAMVNHYYIYAVDDDLC